MGSSFSAFDFPLGWLLQAVQGQGTHAPPEPTGLRVDTPPAKNRRIVGGHLDVEVEGLSYALKAQDTARPLMGGLVALLRVKYDSVSSVAEVSDAHQILGHWSDLRSDEVAIRRLQSPSSQRRNYLLAR